MERTIRKIQRKINKLPVKIVILFKTTMNGTMEVFMQMKL